MFKGSLLVLAGACSFGVLSTIVKTAYEQGFTLGEVTGIQALLGVVILWLIYAIQVAKRKPHREDPGSMKKQTPAWKLVAAGLSTGLVSILYYQCVKLVPASIAIILLMQFTWMSILLESIFFHKRPSFIQLLAVVLALGGTCLASGMIGDSVHQLNMTGIVFGLLAALAYAVFLLLNGRVGNDLPVLKKSALMLTGSCILIFTIFPPQFLYNGALWQGLLKWGFLLALFGTVIPPIFYAAGTPRAGVTLSAILSTAELPVAVCMSWLVLGEQIDGWRWLGVAIIIAAIIFPNVRLKARRNRLLSS